MENLYNQNKEMQTIHDGMQNYHKQRCLSVRLSCSVSNITELNVLECRDG